MPSHRLSDILPDLPDQQASRRPRSRNQDQHESQAPPLPISATYTSNPTSNADASNGRPTWHHDGDTDTTSAAKTGTSGGGDRSEVPDVIMAEASSPSPRSSNVLPPPPPSPPSALPQGNASASSSKSSVSSRTFGGGSPLPVSLTTTGGLAATVSTPSTPASHQSPAATTRPIPLMPQKGLFLNSRVAALSKSAGSKSPKPVESPKKITISPSTLPLASQGTTGFNSSSKESPANNANSPNSAQRNASATTVNTPTPATGPTREPGKKSLPGTMQTVGRFPVFATKAPVMTPNMLQAKANGVGPTSNGSNDKTQASDTSPLVPRSITLPAKRKSTSNVAANDGVSSVSPATAAVSRPATASSPTARISTVLPKCLSELRIDLEALWLANQPRIINEFGALQRTARAVQTERDEFQQQLMTAKETARTSEAELSTAKATIAGLEKTLNAELVNAKRTDSVVRKQRSELIASKAELERIQSELQTVQTSLARSTSEVNATKKQVQTVEKERDAVRAQLLQTISDAQTARTKVDSVETEKRQLEKTLVEARRRNQVLEQANQQFVQEHTQHRKERDESATEKARYEADLQTFQVINDNLYKEIAETQQRAERELESERDRAANLSTSNARLQEEVSLAKRALGNKIDELAKVKADHTAAMQDAEAKLLSMQSQLGQARPTDLQELQTWKEKATVAARQYDEKTLEIRKLQTENSRLADDMKKNQDSYKQLEERLRSQDKKVDSLVKENEKYIQDSAALRKEIKSKSKAREALQKELDTRNMTTDTQQAELEARNVICEALRKDVEDRNKRIESREKADQAAQKQIETLQEEVETLRKAAAAQASEYDDLQGENESLQVEMSLRGKAVPPEADMEALEKRIKDEVAQRLEAEVKKLDAAKSAELDKMRAEKDAEAQRLANEIAKLEAQNAQLVSSSKVLGKRSRHETQTKVDWRKYAEEVGNMFFDTEGVCIACRRAQKNSNSPVVPLHSDEHSQIEHVWTVHRGILEKHREETKKVSKRLRQESVRAGSSTTIVL